MNRLCAAILVVALAVSCQGVCHSESVAKSFVGGTIEGTLSEVDTFNSEIVVKVPVYEPYIGYEETVLSVPTSANLDKGTEDIDLGDLNVGDKVTIKYYKDSSGKLCVSNLEVYV